MILDFSDRLLHPEILMRKRGPLDAQEFLNNMADMVSFEDRDGVTRLTVSNSCVSLFGSDQNQFRSASVQNVFRDQGGKVYCMGRSIIKALMEVDSTIPTEALPQKFNGYIVFPKGVVSDGEDFYQGAYVWIDRTDLMGMTPETQKLSKWAIMIAAISENLEVMVTMSDGIDLRENLDEIGTNLNVDIPTFYSEEEVQYYKSLIYRQAKKSVFDAAISSVLFIHSQKPDLKDAKPIPKNVSRTQIKKQIGTFFEGMTLPATLVHWGWVPSARNYQTQMWYRKAHWRTVWTGEGKTIPRPHFFEAQWCERKEDIEGVK